METSNNPMVQAVVRQLVVVPVKKQTKKERLLALAQKIAQQNAENINEMFEIMKLED